jgi:hypothetical protein
MAGPRTCTLAMLIACVSTDAWWQHSGSPLLPWAAEASAAPGWARACVLGAHASSAGVAKCACCVQDRCGHRGVLYVPWSADRALCLLGLLWCHAMVILCGCGGTACGCRHSRYGVQSMSCTGRGLHGHCGVEGECFGGGGGGQGQSSLPCLMQQLHGMSCNWQSC